MHLDRLTAVLLTYNEEPNIARTLDKLGWAAKILVVDSYSTDRTLKILSAHPRVQIHQRPFDTFAGQCNAALDLVSTEWALVFDADYICPDGFEAEIVALSDDVFENGFSASFVYCINGRPLHGTLYPPRTVLFRRRSAHYEDDGHAHRVVINGSVGRLQSRIHHDDRKPLTSWLAAQDRYAQREIEKLFLAQPSSLNKIDRLRKKGWLVPLLVVPYCLFVKRLILDGRAGWIYTMQRLYAELLLALRIQEARLNG